MLLNSSYIRKEVDNLVNLKSSEVIVEALKTFKTIAFNNYHKNKNTEDRHTQYLDYLLKRWEKRKDYDQLHYVELKKAVHQMEKMMYDDDNFRIRFKGNFNLYDSICTMKQKLENMKKERKILRESFIVDILE